MQYVGALGGRTVNDAHRPNNGVDEQKHLCHITVAMCSIPKDITAMMLEYDDYGRHRDERLVAANLELRAKLTHLMRSEAPPKVIDDILDFARERLHVLKSLALREKELGFLESHVIDNISGRIVDRIATKHTTFEQQLLRSSINIQGHSRK